ncbi:MAG: hypothetical protein K9I85_09125 [Saprospiraceae bacterium]|nr:hypothetical protein [Saprospiraceae bacterium]
MRTSILWPLATMIFMSVFLTSCQKDEETNTPNTGPEPDPIQISCLMVGQQSSFIRFTGEEYYMANNNNITYYADTMVMEVVSEDQGVFILKESLTPYSVSVVNDLLWNADSIYFLKAYVDMDTLWVEPQYGDYGGSWFFTEVSKRNSFYSAYSMSELPFQMFQGQEVDFLGWKTTLNYAEIYKEAHMKNQSLLGSSYPFLNARIDDSSMAFDGPGYTVIYEPKGRLVRSSVVNWWTQSGGGWDRL